MFNYEEKYAKIKLTKKQSRMRDYGRHTWRRVRSTMLGCRMVTESRESVDVHLVFSFLGSGVSLRIMNISELTDRLCSGVSIPAVRNGPHSVCHRERPLSRQRPSSLNPYTKFTLATTDVWVNGLWFTSFSLSLATALVTVLVKQWLHHYLALQTGTPREQSHVQQFRYGGFRKWHVLVIIGLLPVLMHLALGIVFVGLTVFLVPLRPGLSWVIGVGTVAAHTTYLMTVSVPILYPQCPYHTPLSDLVYFPYRYFPKHVCALFVKEVQWPSLSHDEPGAKISSWDELERGMVQETLSAEALRWLFSSPSNSTVHGIVI
ncbi:hypothetical protein IW261DRAFT_921597 [Armillaria novae-zelandiae]|uniref:DUF6535 domain-containing protein n=1 Tax=Armillaria novae-zelandiae TaxID=153914 RepID=A0AA39NSC9_9AGAR|nr:hypothetical protein IW261DRAFT_921597 [Armillaria novae-zelandiae]